jgi:FSR family fosmidomycin resistance protein-like MFS transporter
MKTHNQIGQPAQQSAEGTVIAILLTISFCHLLNDLIQSLIFASYPLFKENYALDFSQIGLITLAYQCTASILQPLVGHYTDKRPKPYSLVIGMGCTLTGLLFLSVAHNFISILIGASMVGMGSSVFHPESSRVARMASGGRHGFAQSVFQVGGNFGTAIGPLLAAFIVIPNGQGSIAWFSLAALVAMCMLFRVGVWYTKNYEARIKKRSSSVDAAKLSRGTVVMAISILLVLIFSKYFYMTSIHSYYTFYLLKTFDVSVQTAQLFLFIFLGAVAAGTFFGGPIGDKIGRKYVIWGSIAGVLPFTLALPYADLFWTAILSVFIGFILSSAFSAILVYAQELIPGRIGMVSGLFFGFAFGMGGIGAAVLGEVADVKGINYVYHICSFLPAIGFLTILLPDVEGKKKKAKAA